MFPNHLTAFDRFHMYGRDVFSGSTYGAGPKCSQISWDALLAHTRLHTERRNFALWL